MPQWRDVSVNLEQDVKKVLSLYFTLIIFFSKIRWHKKNQLIARLTRVLGCWPWLQVKRWKSKLNCYKWWNKIRINLEQNDDKRLAKTVHTSEKNKFIGSLLFVAMPYSVMRRNKVACCQLTGSCMVKWTHGVA